MIRQRRAACRHRRRVLRRGAARGSGFRPPPVAGRCQPGTLRQLDVVAAGLPDNDAGLSGEDWVARAPPLLGYMLSSALPPPVFTAGPGPRMRRSQAPRHGDDAGLRARPRRRSAYCVRLCYVLVTSVILLILLIPFPRSEIYRISPSASRTGSGSTTLAAPPSARSTACALASCCAGHCSLPGPSSAATRLRTPLWQKRCRSSTCSRSARACDLRARNLSNRRTSLCSLHSAPAARKM